MPDDIYAFCQHYSQSFGYLSPKERLLAAADYRQLEQYNLSNQEDLQSRFHIGIGCWSHNIVAEDGLVLYCFKYLFFH